MRKFPSNYRHVPLCLYQLADQRCHGLIMREFNDTAVVQIIVDNNAFWDVFTFVWSEE